MSYILDALKKSDQERRSNDGPTIQTIQRPAAQRRDNSVFIAAVIAVTVIASSAVVAYLWLQRPAAPVVAATGHRAAGVAQAAPLRAQQPVKQTVSDATASKSTAAATSPTVAFSELPDNLRNQIPALTFSFHVYSDDPASRTIIINNRRVKEGEEVLPHLQLKEITREGVVLAWKGHPFYINVVQNW